MIAINKSDVKPSSINMGDRPDHNVHNLSCGTGARSSPVATKFRENVAIFVLAGTTSGYSVVSALCSIFNLDNRKYSIAFRALVVAASVLVVCLRGSFEPTRNNRRFWVLWWTFWFLFSARFLFDHFLSTSYVRLTFVDFLSFAIGFSLLPSLAVYSGLSLVSLNRAFSVLLATFFLGLTLNLAYVAGTSFSRIFKIGRAATPTFNPIYMGHVSCTIVLLCIWKIKIREPNPFRTLTLVIALIGGTIGLIAAGSKGPIISAAAAIGFYIARSPGRKLGTLFSLGAVLGFAFKMFGGADTYIVHRFLVDGIGDSTRSKLLAEVLHKVGENPLLGAGFDTSFYPHNVIFESFVIFGVLSGIPFTVMMGQILIRSWKLRAASGGTSWVSLMFVQYFVGAQFTGSLDNSSTLFIIGALVIKVSATRRPAIALQVRYKTLGPNHRTEEIRCHL